MLLSDYLDSEDNAHSEQGNPCVRCNALYKTKQNVNCYLTADQAMEFAQHLLDKAQLIMDNGIKDAVVQVWNQGEHNEKRYFGLTTARKGPRRKKKTLA
jgi:hypothetical protein